VLGRPVRLLASDEGPALGAAVTALAACESWMRRQRKVKEPFGVSDAVACLVKYREPVDPNPAWGEAYRKGLAEFERRLSS